MNKIKADLAKKTEALRKSGLETLNEQENYAKLLEEKAFLELKIKNLNNTLVSKDKMIKNLETLLKNAQVKLEQKNEILTSKDRTIGHLETLLKGKTIKLEELEEQIQNLKIPNTFTQKLKRTAFDMVKVTGGTFQMGDEEWKRTQPIRAVTVPTFYMAKHPVTQKLWKEVMGTSPSHFKGENLPLENVSWEDAQEFLKKLNQMTGKTYHLPSEAQWKYAARGGNKSKNYKYSGSNNLDEVAWYDDNSKNKTHDVGTKAPNELGIYDMSGNVWEWCQDTWHDDYKNAPKDGTAWESGDDSLRVLRGGSWDDYGSGCRVAYRFNNFPTFRSFNYGFRIASSL